MDLTLKVPLSTLTGLVLVSVAACGDCDDPGGNGSAWDVSDPTDGAVDVGPADAGSDATEEPSDDMQQSFPDLPNIAPGPDMSDPTDTGPSPVDLGPDAPGTKLCSVRPAMGAREPLQFRCRVDQMCIVDEERNPVCLDTSCVDRPEDEWCACVLEAVPELCTERCSEDGNGIRCDFFL